MTKKPCSKKTREKISKALQGKIPWNKGIKGIHCSPTTEFQKGHIPWNKDKKGQYKSKKRPGEGFGRAENNPNWKGKRYIGCKGYFLCVNPRYPRSDGRRDLEHRVIAEKALGRQLKKNEIVHHVNGDKLDNRNCNLLICDNSYHAWLHQRMADLYMKEHFVSKE